MKKDGYVVGKKFKKLVAGVAIAAMAVSVIPAGRLLADSVGSDTETNKDLTLHVDFYDYNIAPKDAKNKVAINEYTQEQVFAEHPDFTDYDLFLFGGDRHAYNAAFWNVWNGMPDTNEGHKSLRMSQYQGIVKSDLNAGNIEFNNEAGIYGVNIFPQQGDRTLEDAGVAHAIYNVPFTFQDQDGTYVYDSKYFASYNLSDDGNGAGTLEQDFTQKGPHFQTGTGSEGNQYGFFPFNVASGETHECTQSRHDKFGMKLQLDFEMPENGKVALESNSSVKKDMVFSFRGDDDVWVFVDGKLCLDLGGIHDTISGNINFATGKVTYDNQTYNPENATAVSNIYEAYGFDKTTGSKHNLTMFYLERGEYDSNCKITFNIPAITPDEPTPTPEITATPEVTPTPEVTATPEITATPDVTPTPEVTATPEVTPTPEVTTTPEVTITPGVTKTPEVTVTPGVTPTPGVTKTPGATSTPNVPVGPVVTPTPNVPVGPVVTPKVTATPNVTSEPIATPHIPVGPVVSPTATPVVSSIPEVVMTPAAGDNDVIIPEETLVPNAPVTVDDNDLISATSVPEVTDETTPEPEEDIDTPDDSTDTVDEDGDVPSNPTKKKTSTTVVDNKVPSTLPKTGAIGVFASENGVNVLWVLVPVAILVAAAFAYARKREK